MKPSDSEHLQAEYYHDKRYCQRKYRASYCGKRKGTSYSAQDSSENNKTGEASNIKKNIETHLRENGIKLITVHHKSTADAINAQPARKIGLRVYGTSGWDREAFLLPGQRLRFSDAIDYQNFSVVVLNLRAPSVLLGFEVGGIVGHKFLGAYRVAMDMDRSQLRLSPSQGSD